MAPTSGLLLVALTRDPAASRRLLRLGRALGLRVDIRHTVEALTAQIQAQGPDALIVDLDIGEAQAHRAVAMVRVQLCNDWVPIILLCRDQAAGTRFQRQAPAAIDFQVPKPLTARALRERRTALRRMITLRRTARSVLNCVAEAVIVIDDKGTIRSFNGAAQTLFGWQPDQVIGCNVSMLMPAPHRHAHDHYLRDYARTGIAKVIGVGRLETGQRKDGTEFPMRLSIADVSDGETRRFVGVIHDLSMARHRDELRRMIEHDALTGLPNRLAAQQALDKAVCRHAAGGEAYSLLFCDVDHFKRINDQWGHRVGDEVLKALSARLRHAVHKQDLVARLAGDEFLILLRGVADAPSALRIAARIAQAISQPVHVGELCIALNVSIGAASPSVPDEPAALVLDRADQRMYDVKRAKSMGLLD